MKNARIISSPQGAQMFCRFRPSEVPRRSSPGWWRLGFNLVVLGLGVIMSDEVFADEAQVAALRAQATGVLAQIEGELTVPGLQRPVRIHRDEWGIAHIYAENSHDLFLAQGFSMAQDRLFQVDLWRRIAIGQTAEIFGEEAIEADRFARLLLYRGDMQAEWTSYSPDTQEIATAFTQGINAYIDQIGDRLPIEFQLAGYRPGRWRPEDILGRMSGIIMSGNWEKEVSRAKLIQAVGLEKARLLAPTDPEVAWEPDPEVPLAAIQDAILAGFRAATRALKFTPATSESNNWVVSGARSSSGRPLLASDPHRSTTLPSLRYLVHLHAPGWNVIGSGEPALPGVALGHNERIAWGFTIVGTDQADLFVEQTNPANPNEYRVGERWEPMKVIRESLPVRGRESPVTIELEYTRHGPVVYRDRNRNLAIALQWSGSEPGGAAYLASLAIDRAQNQAEFLAALGRWKIPCLNFVYADVEGQIGWVAAAATPVRRAGNGLLPVPGHHDHYGWERFLRVDELPQAFNPERGWLATANHNILPPGYTQQIAFDWSNPYRYDRIVARLTAKEQFTLADFQAIQHDSVSIPGQQLRDLTRAIPWSEALRLYAAMLQAWDGDLATTAQAGPLYGCWVQEVMDAMYAQHFRLENTQDRGDLRNIQVVLRHLQHPTEAWFGSDPVARRDALLVTTLTRAVERCREKLGDNPATWTWGQLHRAAFHHPLASSRPEYAQAFSLGSVPRAGDGYTPLNTRHDANFQQIHGATYRHVLDLADWDRGLATSAPGQSGQPGSPYYDNLLPLWATGKYFPLAYSPAAVERVTRHRLRLLPAAKGP